MLEFQKLGQFLSDISDRQIVVLDDVLYSWCRRGLDTLSIANPFGRIN